MIEESRGVSVKLTTISKHFGKRDVLHNISLDLAAGEFVALIGRSGCGKSTLLRIIAGLETISTGDARIDGMSTDSIHPEMRILFQDDRLLPWKSVLQNVGLGLSRTRHNDCLHALGAVGLERHANDWPASLSGGQKQRVALARALVSQPGLPLLDEPLGALDALTRIEMQSLIETIWKQQGFTALLVTHDVSEAIQLADRVILIEDGTIALDVKVTLPHPRLRDADFAALETRLLNRILGREPASQEENIKIFPQAAARQRQGAS